MTAPRLALHGPIVALAAVTLATGAAQAQRRVTAPHHTPASFASIVEREVRLLEWAAATPLTPPERARTRTAVAEAVRGDPVATLKADRNVARMLALTSSWRVGDAEAAREALRLRVALARPAWPARHPLARAERDILTAHDPVVVFDSARRRLVTERSLRVLRTAAAWNAQALGVPGPDASFVDRARQGLRANFARFEREDPSVADGFAHIADAARDEPTHFARATPVKRAALVQQARDQVLATADRGAQQWRLAALTAWVTDGARAAAPRPVVAIQSGAAAVATSGLRFDDVRPTPQVAVVYALRAEPSPSRHR